jgi:P4 family phage/plasmid primase-like protien
MIIPDIVSDYLDKKRALIPISKKEPHSGKRPLHPQWNKRIYTADQIRWYRKQAYNIGFRLGRWDLVLDIDPRNGGKKGLAELNKFCGVDMRSAYPTVETGGGGWHIYFRLPKPKAQYRENLEQFPGVEFKTFGRQVIIPGSIHPQTGEKYKIFGGHKGLGKVKAPHWLVNLIRVRKPTGESNSVSKDSENNENSEKISNKELAKILKKLPVHDFDENDTWFPVMASAHHATGGAGLPAFLEWSLGDSAYSGQESEITARWKSLGGARLTKRTIGTLYHELAHYGAEFGNNSDVYEDFESDLEENESKKKEEKNLFDAIEELPETANAGKILQLVRLISKTDLVSQSLLISQLAKKVGIPRGELKQALANLRSKSMLNQSLREPGTTDDESQELEDLAQQAVSELLDLGYAGGKFLIHASDQCYWAYTGKNWEQTPQNMIEKAVYLACVEMRRRNPNLEYSVASLMPSVERVLRARSASNHNFFRCDVEPPSIINVENGQIHINPKNGKSKLKRHKHSTFLTSCLESVTYDPEATCPMMDQTLFEIFSKESKTSQMDLIRHIWEIFGYCIQYRKNIPAWFLFYGRGANGKSLIIEVLSSILGDLALEQSIGDFDTSRNAHAYSSLPGKLVLIDDDVLANTTLPDAFLKKVSENKSLTANPKYKAPFKFRVHLTPILACNDMPKIKDLSPGMIRRAHVIPFRKTFASNKQDLDLARKIVSSELSGILNRALEGLSRLRKRGNFMPPSPCTRLKNEWLHESNPFFDFVDTCLEMGVKSRAKLSDIFEEYHHWADDSQIPARYRVTKISLVRMLTNLPGIRKKRLGGGTTWILGLKVTTDG